MLRVGHCRNRCSACYWGYMQTRWEFRDLELLSDTIQDPYLHEQQSYLTRLRLGTQLLAKYDVAA